MTEKVPGAFSRLAMVALVLACAGCRDRGEIAGTALIAPPSLDEPAACATCHAEETARWRVSAHRLAARSFKDAGQPPRAVLSPDAPILPAGQGAASFAPGTGAGDAPASMLAPDASGATEARAITHVLGGRRREDFLSERPDGPHVLPLSWSVTRAAWTDPAAEEHGALIDPKGSLGWTKSLRSHGNACSRCHPVSSEGPGITCSTCHPEALSPAHAHPRNAAPRKTTDPWTGCAHCHAVGLDMPRVAGASAAGSGALLDALLPDTLVLAEGFNPAFALDGRPLVPHGREAQSLAQSACFRKGGANCLTCHDPHGGDRTSLKQPDPDASCRTCHSGIASVAATHARHPVATTVPLAIDEPGGPWAPSGSHPQDAKQARLPGCVDCHAPAILGFSPEDAVRDHAIGVPDPATAKMLGVADACSACHPGWSAERLAPALPPSVDASAATTTTTRRARARTFSGAARVLFGRAGVAQQRDALDGALVMLSDADLDPWTRASAATLVGLLGRGAAAGQGRSELAAVLETAWAASSDPVLRRAVAAAHPRVGGTSQALAALGASETDWRVRLAVAVSLASLRDPRGSDELDSLRRDATLPERARAEAAFELATVLLASGSATRAESLLLESLASQPRNAAAWVNLGTLRANSGDTSGARDAWERALELSPSNPIARANLASMLAAEAATAADESPTR